MTEHEDRPLSDEEARRIWRRAAELQAEAAARLEERSKALLPEERGGVDGFAVADVRGAALEAGISAEFVDGALAEMRGEALPASRVARGLSERLVGDLPARITVSRVLDQTPRNVYVALERILPAPPYHLDLIDIEGPDPLDGGVLTFGVPPTSSTGGGVTSDFLVDLRQWADVHRILLSLRPIGPRSEQCEISVSAPMDRARRMNTWAGGTIVGVSGLATGLIGVGTAGPLGLLAVPVALWLGTHGSRALARLGLRRGMRALERLVQSVEVHMRTGGAFAFPGASPTRSSLPPLDGPTPPPPSEADPGR